MIIRFTCEYNGKDFHGFQRLSKGRSVQAVLEDALGYKIVGSGRTDAGVHARGQVCSFECESAGDLYKLGTKTNAMLPSDVAVRDFEIASDGFHARHSVKSKTYLYRVYVSQTRSPVRDEYYHQVYKAPALMGTPFTKAGISVRIEQRDDEIWFWVTGKGFKYKEVRAIVGEIIYGKKQTAPAKGLTLMHVEY